MMSKSPAKRPWKRRVAAPLLLSLLASCVAARPADEGPSTLHAAGEIPLATLSRGFRPGVGHWASAEPLPQGYEREAQWYIPRQALDGSKPLYECRDGASQNLSLDSGCEGWQVVRRAGAILTEAAPGRVPLYRCRLAGSRGRFVSDKASCEGQKRELLLGYVLPINGGPRPIGLKWSFLDNGSLRVGVSLDSGAAIGYLGYAGQSRNYIDVTDRGRFLQQSYYGPVLDGRWKDAPWPLNPVQAGDWRNEPSQILEFHNDGRQIYAKTIPRDWGATGLAPAVMEEWIELAGSLVKIRFRFRYDGPAGVVRDQEVPALFTPPAYSALSFYDGEAAWQGGPLTTIQPARLPATSRGRMSESWVALLSEEGEGLGLFAPGTSAFVSYRTDNCAYVAPVLQRALRPGFEHDYTVHLTLGRIEQIRERFDSLRRPR